MDTTRREVSAEEAIELYESGKVSVGDFRAHAVCVVRDKDGNIKGTFEASTDNTEEDNHAT